MSGNVSISETLAQRQKLLLKIIDSFSETYQHPTSALLHYYVLLCRLENPDLHDLKQYEFRAYMRGPFSNQLRTDLEVLLKLSLVKFEGNNKLNLSEKGKKVLKTLTQTVELNEFYRKCNHMQNNDSPHYISKRINDFMITAELGQELTFP